MIKIINKTDNKIQFKTDVPISLANAIRRSINYIPIMAIDSLEISKNDSALYDEVIAHRTGLIPLVNENLKLPWDCDCGKEEGCGKCSIKLKMSIQGPCVVYSDDLSPKTSVVYKMPLTMLDKEQELEFIAIAKMGLGIQHAKFSPGVLYYKYADDIEDEEAFKKLVEKSKKDKNLELDVNIESWGQITPKEIFIKSVEAIEQELKDFVKAIK
jgi:DNA-directed RNA polymerase subunit D